MNEYNPQAYAAVLLANGYNPDRYWLDSDGGIYSIDSGVLVNRGNENAVMWQPQVAKLIDPDKLKNHNQIAIALTTLARL